MNDMGKNLLLWLIIAAVLLTVFNNFNVSNGPEEVEYSTFLEWVNQNEVRTVAVDGVTIRGERSDGMIFETIQPQIVDKALIDDMHSAELNPTSNASICVAVRPFLATNCSNCSNAYSVTRCTGRISLYCWHNSRK